MIDREMVINGLEYHSEGNCFKSEDDETGCPYWKDSFCSQHLCSDALALLKDREPIKPNINEYGEAYCVCGENVGIIPNSKNLPKILSKYCSECGRRMKWE
jgi:hypothetical protein